MALVATLKTLLHQYLGEDDVRLATNVANRNRPGTDGLIGPLANTVISPAFNSALCERAKIKPLEFDGVNDSLFHPFDQAGRRHMEYLKDRGAFADVPFATIVADFKKLYPALRAASPAAELPRRSHNLIC